MESSVSQHASLQSSGSAEKKKKVSFWSPEEMINNHSNHDQNNLLVEIPNVPTYSAASSYNHQAPIYSKPDRDSYSTPKKPKKEIDSSKAYKCPECEYSFNRRDHLTRHSLVHSKLKPYHCNYCSKDFTRNDHLRRHQQRVHGEETQAAASMNSFEQRFICQECKAIFTSSGHLRVHMENKHQHDYADFITRDPSKTIVHQDTTYVIVDGKKRPVCQLCNKSFSKKDHLTRHINNIHTGQKPEPLTNFSIDSSYNCHLCGKRFSRSEFLRRHLEDAHNSSAQMDIINQLNPNNPYNNNSQVNNSMSTDPLFALQPPHHMMYDSYDIKPIVPKPVKPQSQKTHNCNICSKNFSRRYHLTRHQKNLHPEIVNASNDNGNESNHNQQQQQQQQQQQKKPSIWSPEDMIRAQVEQASRSVIDNKYAHHHHHPYPPIPSYNHHVIDAFSLKTKKETNSQ